MAIVEGDLLFKVGEFNVCWYACDDYYGIVFEKQNTDQVIFDMHTGKQIFFGKYLDIPDSVLNYSIMLLNLNSRQGEINQTFWQRAIMNINLAHKDDEKWENISNDLPIVSKFILRKKPGRKKKILHGK